MSGEVVAVDGLDHPDVWGLVVGQARTTQVWAVRPAACESVSACKSFRRAWMC